MKVSSDADISLVVLQGSIFFGGGGHEKEFLLNFLKVTENAFMSMKLLNVFPCLQ